MALSTIEDFIRSKGNWIEKHKQKAEDRKQLAGKKEYTDIEIYEIKKRLKEYITLRVAELWEGSGLPRYTSIKITKSE
jgi:predicted metal-dependent hydrolase